MNAVDTKISFNMRGHLKIVENVEKKVVFDSPNLIVNEGKGYLMDYLASSAIAPSYTLTPFASIVLTNNINGTDPADTFINSVWDQGGAHQISHEGVLSVAGGFTTIQHTPLSDTVILTGTLDLPFGNDISNNHINSACVCINTNNGVGGPGQAVYNSLSGGEKIFSRVHIGDIVKTATKSFTFQWTFKFI